MTAFYSVQEQASAVLDLTTAQLSQELGKVEGRLHILRALLDALGRIEQVNQTVQFCPSRDAAMEALCHEPFRYTPDQALAVLNLPLSAQGTEEIQRLRQEYDQLAAERATMRESVTEVISLHWFG